MRHAEDGGEPIKARNLYRVAIHARQLGTAAAVVARTPYTRYWSLILCIYYVFVEFRTKHGFYYLLLLAFGSLWIQLNARTHTMVASSFWIPFSVFLFCWFRLFRPLISTVPWRAF